MKTPREIELKLELPPGAVARRRSLRAALPPGGRVQRLVSDYFDTEDGALRRRGLVLRVRQAGRRYVQTVKADDGGGPFDRAEWEAPVTGPEPDLTLLPDHDRLKGLASLGPLRPVVRTAFDRTTWRIERDGAEVELSHDVGEVQGGAAREGFEEIEIELKAGSISGLFAVARDLAGTLPVQIGFRSKAERGFDLLAEPSRGAAKAEKVSLDPEASAGTAFRVVALSCLRQFRLNERAMIGDRDEEALHQARVAIRRLRSAFSLFRRVVAGPDAEAMKRALRALSGDLGRARNLDVFLKARIGQEAERFPGEPGLDELRRSVAEKRELAYDRVARRLRSKRFRLFMIDLARFVEDGAWHRDPDLAMCREQPIGELAAAILDKRWKTVRKRGRHLDRLTAAARHEVRIEAKKLRYASEFFASLAAGKKAKRHHKEFLAALERLQSRLGELNDIATGHEVARDLAEGVRAASEEPALLFAAGHISGEADAQEATLVSDAASAHRALRKAEPFWR